MCKHLVETFAQVLEGSENDEKAITAMGLLNTMETILTVMEDNEELHAQLEPVVLQAVRHIFTNAIMEFYEEALSLTCDLTTTKISNNMWEMLNLIYQVRIVIFEYYKLFDGGFIYYLVCIGPICNTLICTVFFADK